MYRNKVAKLIEQNAYHFFMETELFMETAQDVINMHSLRQLDPRLHSNYLSSLYSSKHC